MISLKDIRDKDDLSMETIIDTMREIRNVGGKTADAADNIIGSSSNFLESHWQVRLITAELTDKEAKEEITRQKRFYKRLCYLLPPIGRLLNLKDDSRIFYWLTLLSDCFHDIPFAERAARNDKLERERVSHLNRLIGEVDKLSSAITKSEFLIRTEFAHLTCFDTSKEFGFQSVIDFDKLDQTLSLLRQSIELVLYKSQHNFEGYSPRINHAKSHVVSCAYDVSLTFNGPKISTTPGSKFSLLCSLLYELMTGKKDESPSGAINRFSLSKERKIKDEDERNLIAEDLHDDNVDNFHSKQKAIKSIRSDSFKIKDITGDSNVTPELRATMQNYIEYQNRRCNLISKQYGPHIVWAHHLPDMKNALPKNWDELNDKLLDLQIEIGVLRRRKRNSA